MRTNRYEDKQDNGDIHKRSVIMFDSFTDLVDTNLKKDFRSKHMDDFSFYGANSMQEADKLARQGLPRLGIEAIQIAHDHVALVAGELQRPIFDEFYDTSGAFVDMGRYVEGTPECMVSHFPTDEPGKSNIVSLVLNGTYNCGISAEAIKKNGQAMMALVESVETCGMQAEIWLDMYVRGWGDGNYRARTAVRLKKAGQAFDVGMFMYALTHNSFLRGHIFNAMHLHDEDVRKAVGISPHGGYGSCISNASDMDDFPPYSIYIPAITSNNQAGKFVPAVLKQLGLIKAA